MSSVKIKYKKNDPQSVFHNDTTSPILMFSAGLGTGKTYALCMKMIQLSWLNRPYGGGLLCPSFPDYKKDILPTFMDIFASNGIMPKINVTDKTFLFPWSKHPLYIFTAEKPIAGPNLAYCGVNEFSLIPEIRINEMMRRVRVKRAKAPQRCLVGTPEDTYGWVEDFVETQEKSGRLRVIHGKTTDNPHLDPDYVEHLRATLDPMAFKLFAEGEMVRLGTDYFYYAYGKHNESHGVRRQSGQLVHVGVDFNVGNMHAICCHRVGDVLHVFDEIVIKGAEDGTHEMARAIMNRFSRSEVLVTCDASGRARSTLGTTDFAILESYGLQVRAKKANPRIRKRQLLVNGLLSNSRILIHPDNCKILIKDLKKVEQHQSTFEKVKTNPDLTHASDCLDYLCDYEFHFGFDRKERLTKRKIGQA